MIAVIGMAARLPGAPDLDAYWQLLREGREGLTRLDPDTLAGNGVAPQTLADPRYVPVAGTLAGYDRFDAGFWDIGAHEAALMDPQQRILLELAWHALEDACIDPRRTDAQIGVFVGAAISTYLLFRLRHAVSGPSAPSQLLAMIGNDKDYMATQLAYRLDLKGPAVSVQTACSSSLVAVHLACQSLLSGECDIALAGGVSVRVPHGVGYLYEAGGMLSPDGHCRSFAEDAAGTVFGSGAGLVVLRRAEDADGHRVRALIAGSAVNNDGSRKIGFTAPSQDRQAAVIAEAMAVAGVSPAEIGYVEAHGTGTSLGDPVEVAALTAAYPRVSPGSTLLGSVKSNIGHTETAAGVAGLVKTVLMLEYGCIVPTLHAERPSSRIDWRATPFGLAADACAWTEKLAAGVSSFGIGGTNAHIVLTKAPASSGRLTAPRLLISARDETALDELTAAYQDILAARPGTFEEIAGAATRRPHLACWVAIDRPEDLPHARDRIEHGGPPEIGRHIGGPPEIATEGAGPPLALPLYPFQRRRHWVAVAEPLLGPPIRTPFRETLWPLRPDLGLLRQHRVEGVPLLPAALHLAAFAELGPVEDIAIERKLPLDRDPVLQLWQAEDGDLRVLAEHGGEFICLATARAAQEDAAEAAWDIGPATETNPSAWATTMTAAGLSFGPDLRVITRLWCGAGGVRAGIAPESAIASIDAGLQALGAAVIVGGSGFRPVAISRFAAAGDLLTATAALARLTADGPDAKTGDIMWLDASGAVLAEARDVLCRRTRPSVDSMLHCLGWRPDHDPALTVPYAALEQAARAFARDALAVQPNPVRPALAALLRPHAEAADPSLADPAAVCADLAARHPGHQAEIALVTRCGAALPAVLAGARDPLEVLFGGASANGAYRESPLARHLNRVAAAVAAAARPARVIEIGGGTAATTTELRSALAAASEYLFTDISPAFLAAASRRFEDWSGFRTTTLDIGRDPATQGITAGAWDLVVAANVLHAAPDLSVALANACRLLAPGGQLLLIEGTEASARLDITFGLTEDWTAHTDRALRPHHPLIDLSAWRRLLADAGLLDIVVVADLDGQAVITATNGPPRWVAVTSGALDALPVLPPGDRLPQTRLTGVVYDGDSLDDLLALSRDLIDRLDQPRLLLPVSDPPSPARAALGGLLRTLAREHPGIRPRIVAGASAAELAIERAIDDHEDSVAWRDGRRFLARLEPPPTDAALPAVHRLQPDLRLGAMVRPVPGPNEVLIRVRAASINFKDVLTAAGQVPPAGPGLGGECAGEIEAVGTFVTGLAPGDQVVAVAAGALATHVLADARLVLPKPPELDFASAAAVPIAGATAWHALRQLASVAAGQRVLVHAATGGVGWFALRLAQQSGAEVVALAGTEAKRARLRELGVREVFSSRDTAFAATAPVDVVLGAMPEAQREAALALLRPGGRFIEIGRLGADRRPARADIAWHLVALDRVEAPVFAELLREVLAAVAVAPSLLPPITTRCLADAGDAFATMMRSAHVGKLVALPTHPLTIRGDGSYLVTGGLGGLGPEIAAWLRRHGAGGVVRLGRRAVEPASDVVVGDVTDPSALAAVDAHLRARELPPLRGVIHAAGVLRDGVITRLDPASFASVAAPKLKGLRTILARWPDLELLIGFSSAGALFGSAGQAAHTAASAAFDTALAQVAAGGRSAVAIDWGAWRDRGAAADTGATEALAAGMGTIATEGGFAALDRILELGVSHAAVLPIDRAAMRAAGAELALLRASASSRPLSGVVEAESPSRAAEVATSSRAAGATTSSRAAGATTPELPPADRRAWLADRVTTECCSMLSVRGRLDPRRPLHELGLDSLAALELRNRLGRLVGAVLPASLLFDYPTVAALVEHLGATFFDLGAGQPAANRTNDLATASDDDLDAALSAFAARYGDDP